MLMRKLINVRASKLGSWMAVALIAIIGQIATFAAVPTILVQPLSQTVPAGAQVTFGVAASGDGQLNYQWRKNGVDLSGQSGASLTITNTTSADAGDYSVNVSNTAGATSSAMAKLTVTPSQLPVITKQPTNQTVSAGANVTFSATATGAAPLSFQWKKNGVDLAGQTSSTLTLNAVTSADVGNYSVSISNAAGVTNSAAAALAVNTPSAPAIVVQPINQTVPSGSPVTFNVTAVGSGQLQYQWKKNGLDLSGQTSASLTINAATAADAGGYSVSVSNSSGAATSQTATLVVSGSTPPAILIQPTNQTANAGAQVTFSVAANGSIPMSFQWRKNGANLSGKTDATLTLNNVSSADAGDYSVVVSNSSGTQTSANATLTVNGEVSQPPSILSQPISQTVPVGAKVNFSVTANGSGQLMYQWKKNGADLAGQTSSALTINSAASADAGDYTVTVSNSTGVTNSAVAKLTIGGSGAPMIVLQPQDQAAAAGTSATFAVNAQGSATLTYQWKLNGVNISGATSATLTITNVQASSAGKYQVVVSNSDGTATSAEANLSVVLQTAVPRITAVLKSSTDNSVSISVTTRAGKTYTLETQVTINASTWNQVSTQQGDGSVKTLTDANASGSVRFYRVREQ